MKPYSYIFLSVLACLIFFPGHAQISFKTIIPQHPVVVNESFQVQYVIENAGDISNFSPPVFTGFRIVAGPHIYSDKNSNSRKNLVLTLAATNEGKLKVPGATCLINGQTLKSNDVFIRVVSKETEGAYFLGTGEDPYKKIRQNLFLKLEVDKHTCFVGEPLVATFKLYSRLESRSNVIKNPGFYGFSVYDMVGVNDKVQSEEKLNGRWFDVHTIRKLQLYPLEAGIFTIDAMELTNEVEFSRTLVKKPTKQEIRENMYDTAQESQHGANNEVYKMNFKSNPLVIDVKPLPRKNSADTFAGAVGSFSINVYVQKDSLLRNEEDSLLVKIDGAGNFQRVNAPIIHWPGNFETFEPSVKDSLDKEQVPLTGQRKFNYVFVSNRPGFYTIPSISFSFFDLKKEAYKTVSTKPFTIFVSAKSKNDKTTVVSATAARGSNNSTWVLVGSSLFVLLTGMFLWALNKRKRAKMNSIELNRRAPILSIQQILMPAKSILNGDDKVFFETLGRCIWTYFNDRLSNFKVPMIKKELSNILISKGIDHELANRPLEIIHQCETSIYSNAKMDFNKSELLKNTEEVLMAIERSLRP